MQVSEQRQRRVVFGKGRCFSVLLLIVFLTPFGGRYLSLFSCAAADKTITFPEKKENRGRKRIVFVHLLSCLLGIDLGRGGEGRGRWGKGGGKPN